MTEGNVFKFLAQIIGRLTHEASVLVGLLGYIL